MVPADLSVLPGAAVIEVPPVSETVAVNHAGLAAWRIRTAVRIRQPEFSQNPCITAVSRRRGLPCRNGRCPGERDHRVNPCGAAKEAWRRSVRGAVHLARSGGAAGTTG